MPQPVVQVRLPVDVDDHIRQQSLPGERYGDTLRRLLGLPGLQYVPGPKPLSEVFKP